MKNEEFGEELKKLYIIAEKNESVGLALHILTLLKGTMVSLKPKSEGSGLPPRELWVESCNECCLSGPFNYNDKCDIALTVTRLGGGGLVPTDCPIREVNGSNGMHVRISPKVSVRSHQ